MFSNSRFITIRGISLHYRVLLPTGPVRHRALLVPSPGQTTYSWRYVVPELTKNGCMCVLCDLPGFGLSECGSNVPQQQTTRARFLWGLLDALDMREGTLNCWNLIAHGAAAGAIAEMAFMQPESVTTMVMINPELYSPLPVVMRPIMQSGLGTALIRRWFSRNILSRSRFAQQAERMYGRKLPQKTLDQLRLPLSRLIGEEEMVREMLLSGYDIDTHALNSLFAPTMILWGGRDRMMGGDVPTRLKQRDFRMAEYHVLKNGGHGLNETHSRAVCDYLRGWIRAMWD